MNERDIFLAALDKATGPERATCVSELCGADRALRERVEALLRADEAASNCLKQFSPDPTATGPEQPVPRVEPAEVPGSIARYRVQGVLGEGSFGIVYLARDDQLERLVAIKVPHRDRVVMAEDAHAYLTEARTVARLDHPNIVPVHDVGSTGEFPCFVVSKYIDGSSLAGRLKEGRLSVQEAVRLTATVAEALHHAHTQGLVHRDIKPGNILLDKSGKPFVADFGLALREQDLGKGPRFAGTPAYMSPEQARGEGHRVDGRSDIFSLGVVFYELLTGRRPFRAETRDELLDQISSLEARPPRQIDDGIPGELERICLKTLAKRASERYTTAKDLAADLRHFLMRGEGRAARGEGQPESHTSLTPDPSAALSGDSSRASRPSSLAALKIVPKGLRSFDAGDADFFVELLPGPRDRDGLPESIRFWKSRIETKDESFAVGLLYGPSGCGKSSLVKAGLLPRLGGLGGMRDVGGMLSRPELQGQGPARSGRESMASSISLDATSVTAVYVEATGEDTEVRLLKELRRHLFPSKPQGESSSPGGEARSPRGLEHSPAGLSLIETLSNLRRGKGSAEGNKVLIVLDQFEQWLHAHGNEENAQLVQALRQCDGGRLQCLVMVRDDFWMAATRFMSNLEISLVQGHNCAAVDLFDPIHARKVLAAFGRAYGRLPENPGEAAREQEAYLDRSVAGLAQDGKVISVRLALFAEMVRGKPWSPATLRQVGGAEGVGITFLEETFAARTAPPHHRLHQKAVKAVLKALLPEAGADIKGHMRSHQELLAASGYANRPKDFDSLLRILDSELRLITPTDPEGNDERGMMNDERDTGGPNSSLSVHHSSFRYYQLTHDYLVPSLRDWLTLKQRETRRGRAEIWLAERTALWQGKPDRRYLPSWWEWANIRLFTRSREWTASQQRLMRVANRHHLFRTTVRLLVCGLFVWLVFQLLSWAYASAFVEIVRTKDNVKEARLLNYLVPVARWANPMLADIAQDDDLPVPRRAAAGRILWALDKENVADFLNFYFRIKAAEVREELIEREFRRGQAQPVNLKDFVEQLKAFAESGQGSTSQRATALVDLLIGARNTGRDDMPSWAKTIKDMPALLPGIPASRLRQFVQRPAEDGGGRTPYRYAVQNLFCVWLLQQDTKNADFACRKFLRFRKTDHGFLKDLESFKHEFVKICWPAAEDRSADPRERYHALQTLAHFDPDSPRWEKAAPWLIDVLSLAGRHELLSFVSPPGLPAPLPAPGKQPGTRVYKACLAIVHDARQPPGTRAAAARVLGAIDPARPEMVIEIIRNSHLGSAELPQWTQGLSGESLARLEKMRLKEAWACHERGLHWLGKKDYENTLVAYDEAIRLHPNVGAYWSNKAWVLATCPDPRLRSGNKAMEAGKKALELDPDDSDTIDAMAAAYAEAGQFDEAVRWQQRLVADRRFAQNEGFRRRLELYRSKRAYHGE